MPYQTNYFTESYAESRQRFRSYLGRVQMLWPEARLVTQPLAGTSPEDDLTMDWIEAEPLEKKEKVLLFTLGEHGIEAYVGAAALGQFMVSFLPQLDPRTTGIVLVHAINPWGMQHFRRTNENNIDLNRNFVWDEQGLDPAINADYRRVNSFLNPGAAIRSRLGLELGFALGLVSRMLGIGINKFRRTILLGQYAFPKGVYYGGSAFQPETLAVRQLYQRAVSVYERILLLDMHTGYGPRYQMSVVNSAHETRSSEELKSAFAYPNVVKTNPSEFYSIQGDMIDYIYTLVQKTAPHKHVYGTSFEFGTFGESTRAVLRSIRATVYENRAYWAGVQNPAVKEWIRDEYRELFYPSEAQWRKKALEDAVAAFQGILRTEGYIA